MRSLLLVQPDRESITDTALAADADCLIFDFSAVAAESSAYEIAHTAFTAARRWPIQPSLYARIPGLHDSAADGCLDRVMALLPDGIVLAACNGADIEHLSIKLAVREAELGIEHGVTKILATVPAAAPAIFGLNSLANASVRLTGLIFAQQDLEQALGIASKTMPDDAASRSPIVTARHLMLFAAKAAKLPAFDAPSPASIYATKLRDICAASRREGFSGKVALSENQIAIINAAYASS
ncbi:MAG: CoA ester lyase [Beijerinckiaceae bacterium]|nr:MAG: CoA ester lyase [Beijerinckiaceae bacterium]